ncbi:MAG: hypothetical protein ACK5IP_14265 [Paracoccus sp. (in: a-proteobacteria)]
MTPQTCETPRPSRLAALWSWFGEGCGRIAGLSARLWPDGAMPQHPCASRVLRDAAGLQRREPRPDEGAWAPDRDCLRRSIR